MTDRDPMVMINTTGLSEEKLTRVGNMMRSRASMINSCCKHGAMYYHCEPCWPTHAEVIHRLSHWNADWANAKRLHEKNTARAAGDRMGLHAEAHRQ